MTTVQNPQASQSPPPPRPFYAASAALQLSYGSFALAPQTVQDPLCVVLVALGAGVLLVGGIPMLGRRSSSGAISQARPIRTEHRETDAVGIWRRFVTSVADRAVRQDLPARPQRVT